MFRRIGHPRFFPTHHTADSNPTFLISHDAVILLERVSLSVKREKFLAVARKPHIDAAPQFIGVESVRWLAEFQHHEIRNVDDVVDGTNANALDFRTQPLRARTHFYIVD